MGGSEIRKEYGVSSIEELKLVVSQIKEGGYLPTSGGAITGGVPVPQIGM